MDFSKITITDITSFLKVNLPTQDQRRMECRADFGLIMALSGKVVYEHNGRHIISDPDTVLLVPRGISYSFVCTGRSENIVVNYQAQFPEPFCVITAISLKDGPAMSKRLNQLTTMWIFQKDSFRARCFAGLYEIIAKLNDLKTKPYVSNAKFEQIVGAIDYMEAHWDDPELTNELLAEQSGISTVYFRKIFTEKYGVSPMRYVKEKRIERAKDLLQSGLSSVTGIAEAVGYNSIFHFSRAFKEATGETPSEFSIRMRKSGN